MWLDHARRGLSAGFTQSQDFGVMINPETKRAIAEDCREQAHFEMGI